ncbi:cAMP-dependent protein kinase catalytic subunit beta-like [Topomyia yanbarensis]|uniref:cAMP-dependent protein kinase catalytic subunit beta-like n=1 Tax=Topomyia yanbarensis TaxID=2498891 RepID=UPI00273CF267|nr:cAMP-dependent protein kinase catalytic subunit beta-like [Topomyia yanbarensis]
MPDWNRFRHLKRQLLCRLTGDRMSTSPEKSLPALRSVTVLKSSPSTSVRGNTTKKFSASSDYKHILNRLKTDFEKRYNSSKTSSDASLSDYDVLKTLGTGAFGVVKLIRKKNTDQYFALKILSKEKIVRLKQLTHTLNEKRILQSVDFPFLVHLECCYKDNSFIYLAMPFICGGEMFSLLRKNKRFGEDQAKFYGAQVALALEYLHHMNLIYRDLKPENILIDTKGYVKITDFGFCKMIRDRTWTLCGTPEYLAPEIIQAKGYGKSVDWWSYGILLYEMAAGYAPFYSHTGDQMALFEKICKGRVRFPSNFSSDLRNLIQNILQTDLTKRYGNLKNGTNDIKQHAWFRATNWIGLLNVEITAPFIPKVSGPGDTSQFDVYDEQEIKVASKCLFIKEFAEF